MKRYIYMTIGLCCFAFAFSGCSEKDEVSESDSGTKIEGIALSMNGSTTEINAETRASVDGITYVINTSSDPTYSSSTTGSLVARGTAGWKLDLNLYNGKNGSNAVEGTLYTAGSFTGGTYDTSKKYWIPTSDKFFPNYFNFYAEAWLYPNAVDAGIAQDQSTVDKLVAQDILYKEKGTTAITIAHTPTVTLSHKRAILDFIISDVIKRDIAEVTVLVGSTPMVPCLVKETTLMKGSTPTGAVDLEYMLILSEGPTNAITVQIKTNPNATIEQAITYKQTVNTGVTLISNACYCFKLQGNQLIISPVTITDWTTGKPVTGEYLGVTEYPTFKGAANETWYLYFDNKLTEPDGLGGTKAKLQTITFNNEGECTIKPDGRIITHIFKGSKPTNLSDLSSGILATPIVLNNMYITLP
jgi:hypothetical protein